jgi:hypothetical protein
LALYMGRVDWNARHRTHLYALGLIEMPHALGAFAGVDFVDFLAKVDGLIGALGLTHITVDAFVGDHQCHGWGSAKFCIEVITGLSATGLSPRNCRAVTGPWASHPQ